MAEGAIIARRPPQFLRRMCDGDTLIPFPHDFAISSRGTPYGTLNNNTPIYASHQTTNGVVAAVTMVAVAQNEPTDRLFTLLKQVKQIEHHESMKTINFYFFDRQTADQWEGEKVPFYQQLQLHDAKVTAQAPKKGK
ncbi:hypothetical protein PybrP1_005061 [[Pythium] brassicae (nom. inval.)]|nr:hypothetical protein PybrP1_005061 [[Pythium] brassicae (nom. inval.)]